jgi:hypothetical protein
MIEEKPVSLVLYRQPIEARIVTLTPELADSKVMGGWWDEDCLKQNFDPEPIDRHWDWNSHEIVYDGQAIESAKVAIVTGEEEHLAVQGAMMISSEAIQSLQEPGKECLLLELLFTAPRNRPELRLDGQPYVVGVGTQLLMWGAWFSREKGYEGRLRLDGSPDFVSWYEKRGLQKLGKQPIVYENVEYTPMELSPEAARELLTSWEG